MATTPLLDAMREYDSLGRGRFHVPGHNGLMLAENTPGLSPENFRFDYTELEGMDVLSEPRECLAESQAMAAGVFGVAHSFYLVNGSTIGLMAGMLAALKPGDAVLLPRNVHRSILSGLILTGAKPVWILPEVYPDWGLWGGLSPETLERAIQDYPNLKAVMISSPTYEGIASDIGKLSQLCRKHHILLLVDEAHGALWPFSSNLPDSACAFDVDLVVHSLHKTAGSLTQTAIAHFPKTSQLDSLDYQQALNTLHTTSPSYLLLASIEASIVHLTTDTGQAQIESLLQDTQQLREQLHQLKQFKLFTPNSADCDPTRIFLKHPDEPGSGFAPRIEAAGIGDGSGKIAYEQATPYGALYLTGLGLGKADYREFIETFKNADAQHLQTSYQPPAMAIALPQAVMSPRDAFFAPGEVIEKTHAVGRIAKETVVHCPPGIPILMPGEMISESQRLLLPDTIQVVQAL